MDAQSIEVGAYTLPTFNEYNSSPPQDVDSIQCGHQILHLSKRDSNSKCIEMLNIFNNPRLSVQVAIRSHQL